MSSDRPRFVEEATRSWWLDEMTREAFMRAAEREASTRMSRSREAHRHQPITVDYLTVKARTGGRRT